jgi:hypothetical protein
VHFFKPAADVELVAARSFSHAGVSGDLAVRVALLDVFSDLVFNGLGVEAEDAEAHFDYESFPVALRGDAGWRSGPVRFEVRGGVSRRPRVRVTFPASGAAPYDLEERVAFAGALIEWHAAPGTSLAARGTVVRADTERSADLPSPADLRLREVTRAVGARARQGLGGPWSAELDLSWTSRPEERVSGWRLPAAPASGGGAGAAQDDSEWFLGATLLRRAPVGWMGRLSYAALDRRAGRLADLLTATNQRLVTEGGYRFASGFEVTAGLRWDVDGRGGVPFDGGQLRFTTAGAP